MVVVLPVFIVHTRLQNIGIIHLHCLFGLTVLNGYCSLIQNNVLNLRLILLKSKGIVNVHQYVNAKC